MKYVTSGDGTEIAYERTGDGPPLLLVHGTTTDRSAWDRVLPRFRESFAVYAMDRRGRGESGDADAYAIAREFEDVAAVADAIEGPVNLVGHSYGGVCALGAAGAIPDLRRLVLYEPPLWTDGREPLPSAAVERMESHVERGENEAVLETFFRDVANGDDRLEVYRAAPNWSRRVATAPTVPRENRALAAFQPDAEDVEDLTVPSLVLLGSDSRGTLETSTKAAHELLPESELVVFDGEGHAAMYTAPDRFVDEVASFCARER